MEDFSKGNRCNMCGCEEVNVIYEEEGGCIFIKEIKHNKEQRVFNIIMRDGNYHAIDIPAWLIDIKEIIESLSKFVYKIEKEEKFNGSEGRPYSMVNNCKIGELG